MIKDVPIPRLMNTDVMAVAVARSLRGNQVLTTRDGPAKGTAAPIPVKTAQAYDNLYAIHNRQIFLNKTILEFVH